LGFAPTEPALLRSASGDGPRARSHHHASRGHEGCDERSQLFDDRGSFRFAELTGLADDVEATKRAIDQQTGPVVLVGHSYAGSVITEAGADPKVSALVYVAALQPDVGEPGGMLMQKFAAPNDAMRAAKNRANADQFFYIPPAKFRETYAADVPEAEAQFLADSQQQLGQKAMAAPATVAAWHTKPTYAILTTEDHLISPDLQRWMYKRSGAKVTEVAASHAVFLSQPDAVAKVIETAAKAGE